MAGTGAKGYLVLPFLQPNIHSFQTPDPKDPNCRELDFPQLGATMKTTPDARVSAQVGADLAAAIEAEGGNREEVSRAVLRWAADEFGSRLCVLSSMADEALVHLATEEVPGIDVVFLDTGYHFAETLGTRDAYAATRPMTLLNITPLETVAEQNAKYGEKLHDRNPSLCCELRKVEPMNRALADFDGWISGMRREDAPTRTDIEIVEFDAKRQKVKINILASWTRADVDNYVATNQVLLNPLRQLGYPSIGCEPCTSAVRPGEDPRAGRWAKTTKTECGLHS